LPVGAGGTAAGYGVNQRKSSDDQISERLSEVTRLINEVQSSLAIPDGVNIPSRRAKVLLGNAIVKFERIHALLNEIKV